MCAKNTGADQRAQSKVLLLNGHGRHSAARRRNAAGSALSYSAASAMQIIALRKPPQLFATGWITKAIGQRSAFLSAGVPDCPG